MDKKEVKKLPFPSIPKEKYTKKYVVSVSKIQNQLIIFVYMNVEHVGYVNFCKIYVSKDEVYTCFADGKVSSMNINDICYYCSQEYVSDSDAGIILDYLKDKTSLIEGMNAWSMLDVYQTRFKYAKKMEKEKEKIKKERALIAPDMKLFKKLNEKQMINRCKKTVFKNNAYLFYEKGSNTAYCNMCGQDVLFETIIPMKHNAKVICPNCNAKAVAKDINRGHKNLNHVAWMVKCEQAQGKVLERYIRCIWDMSIDYRNQNIEFTELIRDVHDENSSKSYSFNKAKFQNFWYWGNYIAERGFMGREPSIYVRPQETTLYNTYAELQKIIQKTAYKYSGLTEFAKGYLGEGRENQYRPYIVSFYLDFWRKHNNVEKLSKIGFSNIVMHEMDSGYRIVSSILNWDGSIYDMLGITKQQFKWLKENPSPTDVVILRKYPNISEKDYNLLTSLADYKSRYEDYMKVKRFTTLHKCVRYLKLQKTSVITYLDYLEMSESLHYDMKNAFNIFPKNLRQAHDLRIAEKKAIQDKLKAEAIEAYNKRLTEYAERNKREIETGNFTDVKKTRFLMLGDLFIRLPYNADEIKKEGETLHHCVGSYVDKVATGETEIFFIRKKDEPDKPFYTLEWKNDQVRQCYGLKNCKETPEVAAFVDTFKQLMTAA